MHETSEYAYVVVCALLPHVLLPYPSACTIGSNGTMWPRHIGQLIVSTVGVGLERTVGLAGTWSGPGAGAGCSSGAGTQLPDESVVKTITFCPQDNPSKDIITKSKIVVNGGRALASPPCGATVGLIIDMVGTMVLGTGAAALGETDTAGGFALGKAATSDGTTVGLIVDVVGALAMVLGTGAAALGETDTAGGFALGEGATSDVVGAMFGDGAPAHSWKLIGRSLSAIIVETLAK